MQETTRKIRWAVYDAEKPVMTVGDLAEELDVSRQTIHDHKDELATDDNIETGTIGQATVFWPSASGMAESPEDRRENHRQMLYGKRAMWLEAKEKAKRGRRVEGESVGLRVLLWERLRNHPYNSTRAYRPAGATKEEFEQSDREFPEMDEWENRVDLPPSSNLSEEELHAFDEEIYLFESDWFGEVHGMGGLERFNRDMRSRLSQGRYDDEKEALEASLDDDLDEYDDDLLDELLPSIPEIIAAGDAADDLFCALVGVEW